jgi:hypothetical protein
MKPLTCKETPHPNPLPLEREKENRTNSKEMLYSSDGNNVFRAS